MLTRVLKEKISKKNQKSNWSQKKHWGKRTSGYSMVQSSDFAVDTFIANYPNKWPRIYIPWLPSHAAEHFVKDKVNNIVDVPTVFSGGKPVGCSFLILFFSNPTSLYVHAHVVACYCCLVFRWGRQKDGKLCT